MNNQICVSVIILTFNHLRFLPTCLESILSQQTTFLYEIIIGEDESNDGTRELCQEYSNSYPDRINLFLRERKDVKYLFGKPIGMHNFQNTLSVVKGKYIAICEGDDYWTDPLKLQKQVDFLEAHPTYAGSFHDVHTVDGKSELISSNYYPPEQNTYDQKDCLTSLRSKYATCSLLFKREVIEAEWPNWFKERSCDEFLDLMITQKGLLAYLPESMAAYRIHDGGIWQGTSKLWQFKDLFYRAQLLWDDLEMRRKYEKDLLERLLKIVGWILNSSELTNEDRILYKHLQYYFTQLNDPNK